MPSAPTRHTASWARRVLALLVDWVASWLVVVAFIGTDASSWWPLLVFWLQSTLGTAFAGASFGQLVTRIRVTRTSGAPVPLLAALLRQALICLVIPPLVFREDGRGLHDLWTDSAAYDLLPRA